MPAVASMPARSGEYGGQAPTQTGCARRGEGLVQERLRGGWQGLGGEREWWTY